MASTINAQTTPFAAIVQTADNTGNLAFQTANVTAMTIDTSQNVGIGTASPSNTFVVGGSNPQIQISGSGTSSDFRMNAAYGAAAVAAVGTVGAHPMFFFTSNTERMRIDSSGNVGIGTSSPSAKLESVTTTSGAGGWFMAGQFTAAQYPMIRFAATTPNKYSSIGNNADGGLRFLVNGNSGAVGTEALTLDSSGNLGLGVTPSAWDAGYQVFQNSGGAFWSGSTAAARLTQNTYYASSYKYVNTAAASMYAQVSGSHQWFNAPSGTAGTAISFTQAMTLDASGNLGIGSTAPTTPIGSGNTGLVIANSTTNQARIHLQNSTSGYTASSGALYSFDGTDVYQWNYQSGTMRFGTNNTERFRIGSAGQLGIGGANYGTSGQVLVSQGSSSPPTWGSGSKVLQVLQTVKTDTFSTTSTSFVDVTGLSVSITPSSSSSKILVSYTFEMSGSDNGLRVAARLVRDSTAIYIGDASGSRARSSFGTTGPSNSSSGGMINAAGQYLDSPATTSAITYKIQIFSEASGYTAYVGRSGGDSDNPTYSRVPSSITVMEIAG